MTDVPTDRATARAPDSVTVAAVAVVLASALLIFFSLDARILWMDEAETALLGRSILVHGVPTAFDGRNIVSQEVGREYGSDYVWRWTPWLDKYLAAAAFAVLGESTFSARFPFALLGLLCIISVYPLALALRSLPPRTPRRRTAARAPYPRSGSCTSSWVWRAGGGSPSRGSWRQ